MAGNFFKRPEYVVSSSEDAQDEEKPLLEEPGSKLRKASLNLKPRDQARIAALRANKKLEIDTDTEAIRYALKFTCENLK